MPQLHLVISVCCIKTFKDEVQRRNEKLALSKREKTNCKDGLFKCIYKKYVHRKITETELVSFFL